jgi:hypothetical protein
VVKAQKQQLVDKSQQITLYKNKCQVIKVKHRAQITVKSVPQHFLAQTLWDLMGCYHLSHEVKPFELCIFQL